MGRYEKCFEFGENVIVHSCEKDFSDGIGDKVYEQAIGISDGLYREQLIYNEKIIAECDEYHGFDVLAADDEKLYYVMADIRRSVEERGKNLRYAGTLFSYDFMSGITNEYAYDVNKLIASAGSRRLFYNEYEKNLLTDISSGKVYVIPEGKAVVGSVTWNNMLYMSDGELIPLNNLHQI